MAELMGKANFEERVPIRGLLRSMLVGEGSAGSLHAVAAAQLQRFFWGIEGMD